MPAIGGPVYLPGKFLFIITEGLPRVKQGHRMTIAHEHRRAPESSDVLFADVEHDGNRPRETIGEALMMEHAPEIVLVHESFQRTEHAGGNVHHIRGQFGMKRQLRERVHLGEHLISLPDTQHAIDEFTTMGFGNHQYEPPSGRA